MAEQIRYNQLYDALSPVDQQSYAGYKLARNLVPSERETQDEAFPDYKEILDAEAAANKTKPNMWNPMNWIFSPAESAMATSEERAAVEKGSADIERDLGYDYPGYDQVRNPQQYYMENRPEYGHDKWWEGPIGTTGRRPDDGGYIEYQEPYPHMESYRGRKSQADMERFPFLKERTEFNPLLQRALISQDRKNLYGDEEITEKAAIDFTNPIQDQDFNLDFLEKEYGSPKIKEPFQDYSFSEYQGPSEEEEGWDYSTGQGIPGSERWRNFLSKVTRQPYRPAMGGVTMGSGRTYSPAQLNKMNALGGRYSGPFRAARRSQKRTEDMLIRRAQGKPYSFKNLKEQSGGQFDFGEGRQGSYTARTAEAPAGIDVSSGMGPGGRHYMRGGRVGYNTGGRVGILSIF